MLLWGCVAAAQTIFEAVQKDWPEALDGLGDSDGWRGGRWCRQLAGVGSLRAARPRLGGRGAPVSAAKSFGLPRSFPALLKEQ